MVQQGWSDGALLRGYLARPATGSPRAGLVVCPDHDGVTPFLENLARWFAKAGVAALVLDPFSREGGTAAIPAAERAVQLTKAGAAALRQIDIRSASAYLVVEVGLSAARLAVVGCSFGGLDAWEAAKVPQPAPPGALVLFSTRPALLTDPAHIQAAVLLSYGRQDRQAMSDLPALERRLREAHCDYTVRRRAGATRDFWREPAHAEPVMRETLAWLETRLVRGAEPGAPAGAAGAGSPSRREASRRLN